MTVTNDKRRELAAKVRDVMGELATIELDGIPLADLIEPTECDECSTPNRFEELTAEIHEAYENLADALDRRLMPEGMEWPRYESGELVEVGDEFMERGGVRNAVHGVAVGIGWFEVYGFDGASSRYSKGERVKRPPVLAADGEPLEVGQTVWETDVESDTPLTVVEVSSDLIRCEYTWKEGKTYRPCYLPDQLTHQRPVLDADGVPIRKWDTVYGEDGKAWTVSCLNFGEEENVTARADDGEWRYLRAESLTHTKPEPPDSWERVEDDAKKDRCSYFGAKYLDCERCTQPASVTTATTS